MFSMSPRFRPPKTGASPRCLQHDMENSSHVFLLRYGIESLRSIRDPRTCSSQEMLSSCMDPSSDRKFPHIRGQQSRPFVLIWIMSTSLVSPMVLRQSIFSRSLPRYEPWLKLAHSSFTPGSQSNNLTRSASVAVIVGPIVGLILLLAIGIILFKRRRRPKARYSRPVRWSSGQRAGRRIANGNRI